MMDNTDDSEDGSNPQERDTLGLPSPSSSFNASLGLSLGASHDFRQMLKPPNKKKYEEELERLMQEIKIRETELKSLGGRLPEGVSVSLEGLRAEKDANISKRKRVDAELKQLNLNIQKLRGSLSTTESNLHYKNEAKIDEAIRKLEYQLKVQNFKLSDERKIVAEIDKLKRSKKVLVQYFTQKRELDDVRAKQNRLRAEREYLYKSVTTLKNREDDVRKSRQVNRTRSEVLKKEMDELYNSKRKLFADFKQQETDYNRLQKEHKKAQRKESFKKREEEKRAKEMAYRKEMLEFEAQKEPFEDEKNLCNTLMSYLQRYTAASGEGMDLASPREEQPDTPMASAAPSIADSLDDGKFVLLKKSDDAELDYSISNKRPSSRRGKKSRKPSVTKPLAHTPQIIAQFASLNLNAPSNMSEVAAALEQLQARKRYYDEHTVTVPRPILGSLSGSFSSSGSMSSMESPLRERSSTWGFVEVPPAIMENQTLSDCGRSAESGFHDMSRQASKTESSESAADTQPLDHALEEMIQQSAEYDESEHSRSSSDTVTAEDHITEDCENVKDSLVTSSQGHRQEQETGTRNSLFKNINQFRSHDTIENHTDNDSAVFEMSTEEIKGEKSHAKSLKPQNSYDRDFPATLTVDYMTKDKSQTFQNEPNKMSFSDIKDNKIMLPSNSSVTSLPSNQESEIMLPSNTDSVQVDNKHPGDVDIYSDAGQASNHDHVPNSDSNAPVNVPVTDADSSDYTVTESNFSDDTSFHIRNQNINYLHTSATISDSQTDNICEPKRVNNPEPPIANRFIDLSDKGVGTDTSSEANAYLLCDSNEKCDKTTSAVEPQYCDASLEGIGVNTDGVGIDCIEGSGVVSIEGAGIDVVTLDYTGISCTGGAEAGDFEGASGFEDSLGASGNMSDTGCSAQELDYLVEDTSI